MADSLSELGKFDFNDRLNSSQVAKGRNNTTSGSIDLNSNKSLFQRNAIIDYAKYVTDDVWTDYKRDSGSNGKFLLNNPATKLNKAVPGDSSIKSDGLSINHLITWSEKYPAIQLRYQDFVFCKNVSQFPNNRLIVLRRFKNGVPDNLFDYHVKNDDASSNSFLYTQPLATMVTWLKPDESPLTVTFNEGWESSNRSIFSAVAETLPGKDGKAVVPPTVNNFDSAVVGVVLQSLGGDFRRVDGVDFFGRSIEGNPNLINSSVKRSTGPDKSNINSTISFPSLSFEYEMRYINGVDPGIAIIDLISNCLRMGTSVSEFKYHIKNLEGKAIANIINGDFQINFKNFEKNISQFFDDTQKATLNTINKIVDFFSNGVDIKKDVGKSVEQLADNATKQFISAYRESLKGALAADTGMPSGIWHITIGNPKNPIVSCGDLYVKSSKLELGKELGYNDFPNSFTVTYTLECARSRGRDELERIFNAGRGRIYVYEDWEMNPDYDQYVAKIDTK